MTPKKTHIHAPEKIEATPATCTEDGNISYYHCDGCDWYFLDGAHPGTTGIAKEDTVAPATGHKWSKPEYKWAKDKSTVTATRVCKNSPCKEKQTETAKVTSRISKEPTATEPGERIYSAEFKNEAFLTQVRVEEIPPLREEEIPPLPAKEYVLTFNLNGGSYKGSKAEVKIKAHAGDTIKILAAPKRAGYKFKYWKGSKYYPGNNYKVTENHTFTAQWKKVPKVLLARMVKSSEKSMTVVIKAIKGAKKYVFYGNRCNSTKKIRVMKKFKVVKATKKMKKTIRMNITKVLGKKVLKKKYYKIYVAALDAEGKIVAKSLTMHIATKGGKIGNYRSVSVKGRPESKKKWKKISMLTLEVGKSYYVKGKGIKEKGKKIHEHRKICYVSSDKSVVEVTEKGKITAKGKGSAKVYVIAQNGIRKAVNVTVK